ncbi:N-acyl homoserine lactonase family protein [Sphingomonas sp. SUN019]|uniref:N-acyl homoserine lactonase family protein n=1 Tax=Sphingomonas sp. SUN019 TaxID=2937788 RepID=UPI00216459A8|nr:N-acyl homoserine lactonase family protein [Sphingomonas sp. SUN019]UVO52342.1 N-acyl homoserine lactonase family protein [Sphingomonas sp. SUN019]
MRRAGLALIAAVALMGQAAPPAAVDIALWRLDCGRIETSGFAAFSDTGRYDGKSYKLVDSCYLIKHGADYMLWDTGLSRDMLGKTVSDGKDKATLTTTIVDQLRSIGVSPAAVRYVGISHYHDDHTGQAGDFPAATLLIGAEDWAVIDSAEGRKRSPKAFGPWRAKQAKVDPFAGDRDVFGDGTVTMLGMPGHTPGHHALLVKLREKGPVLLSGDQFHATESFRYNQVPAFNTNRADTLASSGRFREIAVNQRATIIIQHEPDDVDDLPAFPKAAR